MARLFKADEPVSAYRDRRFRGTHEEYLQALQTSTTVYIGNLSFYTSEEQIYEVFSKTGEIKKIIMGLDKNGMTPCGFCFVQYYTREDTEDSVKFISGSILDDRPIRVDFDWGFEDGRQWGRGRSGGQVRDEYRTDYDPGRGGYGKCVQEELELRRYGELGSPEMVGPPRGLAGRPYPVMQPLPYIARQERPAIQRPREGGRKRGREEAAAPPSDGVKPPAGAEARAERNPRFRERGDDSDEEREKA